MRSRTHHTVLFQVRCTDSDTSALTVGYVYDVVDEDWEMYTLTDNLGRTGGWWKRRFSRDLHNLPEGWIYCKCGATTSNSNGMCCECKPCK